MSDSSGKCIRVTAGVGCSYLNAPMPKGDPDK